MKNHQAPVPLDLEFLQSGSSSVTDSSSRSEYVAQSTVQLIDEKGRATTFSSVNFTQHSIETDKLHPPTNALLHQSSRRLSTKLPQPINHEIQAQATSPSSTLTYDDFSSPPKSRSEDRNLSEFPRVSTFLEDMRLHQHVCQVNNVNGIPTGSSACVHNPDIGSIGGGSSSSFANPKRATMISMTGSMHTADGGIDLSSTSSVASSLISDPEVLTKKSKNRTSFLPNPSTMASGIKSAFKKTAAKRSSVQFTDVSIPISEEEESYEGQDLAATPQQRKRLNRLSTMSTTSESGRRKSWLAPKPKFPDPMPPPSAYKVATSDWEHADESWKETPPKSAPQVSWGKYSVMASAPITKDEVEALTETTATRQLNTMRPFSREVTAGFSNDLDSRQWRLSISTMDQRLSAMRPFPFQNLHNDYTHHSDELDDLRDSTDIAIQNSLTPYQRPPGAKDLPIAMSKSLARMPTLRPSFSTSYGESTSASILGPLFPSHYSQRHYINSSPHGSMSRHQLIIKSPRPPSSRRFSKLEFPDPSKSFPEGSIGADIALRERILYDQGVAHRARKQRRAWILCCLLMLMIIAVTIPLIIKIAIPQMIKDGFAGNTNIFYSGGAINFSLDHLDVISVDQKGSTFSVAVDAKGDGLKVPFNVPVTLKSGGTWRFYVYFYASNTNTTTESTNNPTIQKSSANGKKPFLRTGMNINPTAKMEDVAAASTIASMSASSTPTATSKPLADWYQIAIIHNFPGDISVKDSQMHLNTPGLRMDILNDGGPLAALVGGLSRTLFNKRMDLVPLVKIQTDVDVRLGGLTFPGLTLERIFDLGPVVASWDLLPPSPKPTKTKTNATPSPQTTPVPPTDPDALNVTSNPILAPSDTPNTLTTSLNIYPPTPPGSRIGLNLMTTIMEMYLDSYLVSRCTIPQITTQLGNPTVGIPFRINPTSGNDDGVNAVRILQEATTSLSSSAVLTIQGVSILYASDVGGPIDTSGVGNGGNATARRSVGNVYRRDDSTGDAEADGDSDGGDTQNADGNNNSNGLNGGNLNGGRNVLKGDSSGKTNGNLTMGGPGIVLRAGIEVPWLARAMKAITVSIPVNKIRNAGSSVVAQWIWSVLQRSVLG
ncbi:hypothetical protein HDU76_003583 [Blyttiomyces sp. JEL0837]|nr:hypothetical protein HDU76_003583 [Blyttiomyces sp. JEL0837]